MAPDTSAPGVLAGIRVLDLTRLLPGGYCSMLLADLGADVVKVEDVGMGDYLRWSGPFHEGVERSAASAVFIALNRGKRSIRLDLKTGAGREVFLRLARDADVVLESFRPGVMERLGLDHATLAAENPRLVSCAISGFGQDGAHRLRAGHDLNYTGLVGLLDMSGEAGGPPVQSPTQIADIGGGGLLAAVGVLAALVGRQATGRGRFVDVSMTHGAASFLAMAAAATLCDGRSPERGTLPLGGGMICYRPYRCRDGWVTLGAVEEKFWAAFCAGIGRPDLLAHQHDPPGTAAHLEVETIFAARSREEWAAFAGAHDCCLEPVLTLAEAIDSPLLRDRGMVARIDQPGADAEVRALGCPVRLSDGPSGDAALGPAPALGAHTAEVLAEAGLGAEEITGLIASGAAAGLLEDAEYSFAI